MRRSLNVLVSQLPVAECRRRLEAAAEPDVPIVADMRLKYGILASVDDDGFRLRVRHALIHNGISSGLSARFRPKPGSTLIELHFYTSPFWAVWASLAGAVVGAALGISLVSVWTRPGGASWFPAAMSLLFLGLLTLGFLAARRDRHDLTRFVERTLEAAPTDTPGGLTSRLSGPA